MLRRRVSLLVVAFLMVVFLTACGESGPKKISEINGISSSHEIYVDEETDVMYLFTESGYGGGLTEMVNLDGTPKLSKKSKYATKKISDIRGISSSYTIYVDEETDVMYLFTESGYGGGLTEMVNLDGTPKLSKESQYATKKISDIRGISSSYKIYVDEETDVMYLFTESGYGGGLTKMVNSDGTPKLSKKSQYATKKISDIKGLSSSYEIYVDEETDVMYLFTESGYGGGLTEMVNSDGTPKLSKESQYATKKISDIRGISSTYEIYVDEETDVTYLFTQSGYGGGLTTMFNGKTPKTK